MYIYVREQSRKGLYTHKGACARVYYDDDDDDDDGRSLYTCIAATPVSLPPRVKHTLTRTRAHNGFISLSRYAAASAPDAGWVYIYTRYFNARWATRRNGCSTICIHFEIYACTHTHARAHAATTFYLFYIIYIYYVYP